MAKSYLYENVYKYMKIINFENKVTYSEIFQEIKPKRKR